jgi:hypothetical protein
LKSERLADNSTRASWLIEKNSFFLTLEATPRGASLSFQQTEGTRSWKTYSALMDYGLDPNNIPSGVPAGSTRQGVLSWIKIRTFGPTGLLVKEEENHQFEWGAWEKR